MYQPGNFREEAPRPQGFVAECMYARAFESLRPTGQQRRLHVRGAYTLRMGGEEAARISGQANGNWQSLELEARQGRVAIYSDQEIRAFGRFGFFFGEFAAGKSLLPRDETQVKLGAEGEISGKIRGRVVLSDWDKRLETGVSVQVTKEVAVAGGLEMKRKGAGVALAATVGAKFSPCEHFQVAVMNSYDGSVHRPTAAVYGERKDGRVAAAIVTSDEFAVGGRMHLDKDKRVEWRPFFDLFRLSTRQELSLRISESSFLTLSGNFKNAKFSAQLGVRLEA